MTTSPSLIKSNQALMKGFVLMYAVSGEKLETAETVQAVVRLPYCLYVPSSRYLFNSPADGGSIGVVPQKVWTARSDDSTINEPEYVVANRAIYLDDPEIITEWIGHPGSRSEDLQAHNMEFERDPNGYFRYTRLTLEFDWQVPGGYQPSQERGNRRTQEGEHPIVAEISRIALPLVNHVIDVYRTATDDVYIERIPVLAIEDIRIGIHDDCSIRRHEKRPSGPYTYKYGYYQHKFGMYGIRPAMVSKPKEVVDAFRSLLENGFEPPVHELLRQNAMAALERHDAKLAVIESFISLEQYVEHFYYDRLSETMKLTEIELMLGAGDNWKLGVRLKKLLREHFGKAISDIDNSLWAEWNKSHRQRHGIVHRNVVPDEGEARRILQLNESVKQAMGTL